MIKMIKRLIALILRLLGRVSTVKSETLEVPIAPMGNEAAAEATQVEEEEAQKDYILPVSITNETDGEVRIGWQKGPKIVTGITIKAGDTRSLQIPITADTDKIVFRLHTSGNVDIVRNCTPNDNLRVSLIVPEDGTLKMIRRKINKKTM